jgi:hypothetical protein
MLELGLGHIKGLVALFVKVLLAGWLVAGSEEYWWQSVVGSLIQVLLPWSVTQSGASVDMTGLEVLLVKVLLFGWLVAGSEEDWWQSVVGSLIQVFLPGDSRYSIKGTTPCWSWAWVTSKGWWLFWSR